MKLTRLAIHRPTAVAMAALAVVVTGAFSAAQLPLELTPDVSFPKLSVITQWPDSSPEAVEAFVTSPIEAAANTVTGVRKVRSTSTEGESQVDIEFARGTDMDFAALELSEKLSLIREDLPYGTLPPRIRKYVPKEFQTGQFLSYHLTGRMPLAEIRRFALERIRGPLLAVEGVADVQVLGGKDPELRIEINRQRMRALGVSEEHVRQTLSDLNLRAAAGLLYRGSHGPGRIKYDLVIDGSVSDLEQIRNLVLTTRGGSLVRLGDVARVGLAYGQPRSLSRIDGNPAIVLNIEREVGTNTVKVADRVFARLAELEKGFPPTLRLIKERDQSEKIRRELSDLASRAAFSVVVIFLVLLGFLRRFVTPLVILSTIFLSVLLTLNLFYFAEIGLNLLTLAGLALGFGMLVDNAIVVLDNIHRHHELGETLETAAHRGASEVTLPIVASTLTTVAAFVPFLYLTGELRIYYLPFAMAVGLSLVASLLVAFSVTPSLAVRVLKDRNWKLGIGKQGSDIGYRGSDIRDQGSEGGGLEEGPSGVPQWSRLNAGYRAVLRLALRHRGLVILLTLAIFGGSYRLFDKHVIKGRIWSWGADTYLRVLIDLPTGGEMERTDQIAHFFEEKLVGLPHLRRVFTHVYSERARIEITFPEDVQQSAYPLVLKEQLTVLANQHAGAEVRVYGFGPSFFGGGGAAPNFHVQVLGYNYNEVRRIAEDLGRKLTRNARVRNVETTSSRYWWRDDLFEIVLRPRRQALKSYRLSVEQLLFSLQGYLQENLQWQRIKLAGRELDYRLKFKGYHAFDMENLQRLQIQTPTGEKVRLSDVAEVSERKVLARIDREDQQYERWVTFEYRGPWKMGNRWVESVVKSTQLPPGYRLERPRWFLPEEEKKQIYLVLAFSLLLVYMVTAGLFESLLHPFVVMLTVPLALVGVFLIFYLTDTNFDRSAYIGVILLGGIVVNNSIILTHHINDLRRHGLRLLDAVVQGASDRLRPILMTSTTTILGLLPLVLFTRGDTSIWHALALATIGGLLSSTLLVLVVIPVVYVTMERLRGSGTGK